MYDGEFAWACLDTGAQKAVCRLVQAKSYAMDNPGSLNKGINNMKFTFGHQLVQSMGLITTKLPLDDYTHSKFEIHVLNLDIPLIIGLDILKSDSVLFSYIEDRLDYRNLEYRKPLSFKCGQMFLEWNYQAILSTRGELTRMNLHFMHPRADRLF